MNQTINTSVKDKILIYFKKNCIGQSNAVKKSDLIKAIHHCYGITLTERDLRDLISEIPEIGSHNSIGYFYIQTKQDLDLFLSESYSRINALRSRAKRSEENFYGRKGNQGELL